MCSDLIGASPQFQAVLNKIRMVAQVDSVVLLQGETGTGKELIARAIHDASPRRHRRFVAVNCSAIPATLLESEFFGYERAPLRAPSRRRWEDFKRPIGEPCSWTKSVTFRSNSSRSSFACSKSGKSSGSAAAAAWCPSMYG